MVSDTPFRAAYKAVMRQYRIAHNQTPILSDAGIHLRNQAASAVRKLTGRFEIPSLSVDASYWLKRDKLRYAPSAAFRRYLRTH